MFDDNEWYTRRNIADKLKVHEHTVINWEKTRGLPADKLGHIVRARGLELNAWIAAQKSADTASAA
jgi:hypothetical protein